MDLNIEKRIREFQNHLKMNLPIGSLRYLTDLGKINFFLKTVFRRKCHIKTDMENLFESKKKVPTIGLPDAKNIFTNRTIG